MSKVSSKNEEIIPEVESAKESVAGACLEAEATVTEKPTKAKRARIMKKSKKVEEENENDETAGEAAGVVVESDTDDDTSETVPGVDDETEEIKVVTPRRRGRGSAKSTKSDSPFSLEDLTKANVWGLNEQELFDMYAAGRRQDNFSENEVHYMNLIRPVFDFRLFDINNRERYESFMEQGFFVYPIPSNSSSNAVAIKRRPVKKITDLTLENIYHIQPSELLRLIDENLGTGWQGLPLYLQDIILAGFYVDCSVLPEFALHKEGGIVDRRQADGYEVLEITRGTWIEAIFVKVKPKQDKMHFEVISDKPVKRRPGGDEEEEDEPDDDEELDDDDEELDDAEEDEDVEDIDEEEPEFEELDAIDSDTED